MLLLDGKYISKIRLEQLRTELQTLKSKKPGLCVIRVGEDPASKVYVSKKIKTCRELGINSEEIHLSENVSQDKVLSTIRDLNEREDIHGILVQLPLPAHLNSDLILESLRPEKDVDGFHPLNMGYLLAGDPRAIVACTPLGIMRMLEHYKIDVKGKRAVVMGRSRVVGRPMSLLLDHAGATVCVVHSQTPHPEEIAREADILVVAIGKARSVGETFVKEGAVVIDVGIHRTPDGKIVGDVRYEEVEEKASAITPVPGGVGPMTICSLLENCLKSFKRIQSEL